jgi:hypothetical protein
MSIHSTGLGKDQPLVVSPSRAKAMLDIGTTRLYEMINSGQLESFKDGKNRKITMRSIHAHIDRLIAESAAKSGRAA